jgi:hypothetical protein
VEDVKCRLADSKMTWLTPQKVREELRKLEE